jgi:hypothetical protein
MMEIMIKKAAVKYKGFCVVVLCWWELAGVGAAEAITLI